MRMSDFNFCGGYMPLAGDAAMARHGEILEDLRLDLKIAADGNAQLAAMPAKEICRTLQHSRQKRSSAVSRILYAASAVYSHELYFTPLVGASDHPSLPEGESECRLAESFGSVGNFFYLVRTLAGGTTSPGFLWLYEKLSRRGRGLLGIARLPLYTIPDLSAVRPLMCIDLWEHAYIDRFGRDISGYADAYLRQVDWARIFGNTEK